MPFKTFFLNNWQEEEEMTEDEMVGWHHQLNGHEFEQAPGVGNGQRSLTCCKSFNSMLKEKYQLDYIIHMLPVLISFSRASVLYFIALYHQQHLLKNSAWHKNFLRNYVLQYIYLAFIGIVFCLLSLFPSGSVFMMVYLGYVVKCYSLFSKDILLKTYEDHKKLKCAHIRVYYETSQSTGCFWLAKCWSSGAAYGERESAGLERVLGCVSSVAQLCPTLYDPMDCSMSSLPVYHQLPEFGIYTKPSEGRNYFCIIKEGCCNAWQGCQDGYDSRSFSKPRHPETQTVCKKKGTLCQATLGITFSSMNDGKYLASNANDYHRCFCFSIFCSWMTFATGKLSRYIDECSDGFVQCDSRANCINLPGWYHCECRDGYHDNGMFSPSGESCEDIDECGTGRHSCANDTICFNLDGGYDCRCPHGKNCTGDCIHDGKIKHNGQIWVLENDRCSVCSCQNGFVMCRRMVCDCENPTVDLFCCPECDPRLSSQCLHQNGETLYNSGDTWVQNCQQCRCLQGEVDCWPLPCPEVECEFSVLPENECCPRCVTDPCQADTIRNDITKTCLDEMNVVRFTGSSWIKHGTECTLCQCK
ncbi:hypothetical protein FD755_010096, partial [Muntiacus reevesi]